VKSLEEQGSNISRKMDHLNPKSWKGDTCIGNLILRSCWDEGRRLGERNLADASMDNPFQMMEDGDGYDIIWRKQDGFDPQKHHCWVGRRDS
jgi:hypothetical protein